MEKNKTGVENDPEPSPPAIAVLGATPASPAPETLPPGYFPMGQFEPEDTFIVGYPKSGNTWAQRLIAGVVYGIIPEYAPAYLVAEDLVPDVHFNRPYRRHSGTMLFKSHHLPRPEYRRVIYLLRDGRDAMVSYKHHLKMKDLRPMVDGSIELFPSRWHEHVEQWMANPFAAEMMTVRYEDLKSDAVRELKRVCKFLKVQRPESLLQQIADSASFKNLRKRERKKCGGILLPPWAVGGVCFFRRGEVGSYRDEMPEDIQEEFLKYSADTLQRQGYL